MWQKLQILVVSETPNPEVQTVLKFMGEECVVAAPQDWPSAEIVATQLLAVVLTDLDDMPAWIAQIRDWDAKVPILCVCEKYEPLTDTQQESITGVIDIPLQYVQIIEKLYQAQLIRKNRHARKPNGRLVQFEGLVGNGAAMQVVKRMIAQVAETDVNVLILGESGTGKEVVARNLHNLSTRSEQPFIPVNCGAIPGELLESELFGHEKGAFTGAITSRQGRFEMAQGGTLFLDEIGDMPLPMQVKLLRVLQERTFERVGGNKTIQADVRVIAATHRNLEDAIEAGKFREDLYYRLNVFPIDTPALRERTEDIPLLINELVMRIEQEGRGNVRFTPNALGSLKEYDWPGNVRELSNLVERMVILYPEGIVDIAELPKKYRNAEVEEPEYENDFFMLMDEIEEPDISTATAALQTPAGGLPADPALPDEGFDLKEYLAELEISLINKALDDCEGVVARAAERLGMRRTTLVEKMRKYAINR